MVDQLIVDFLKKCSGKHIIFWNKRNFRFEGQILLSDDEYLIYHDFHKEEERLVKLTDILEVKIR